MSTVADINTDKIDRDQFPVLNRTMRGKPLVYLDNSASSLTPESVLTAMDEFYHSYRSNIHRGVYELSEKATAAYDRAREVVAGFIGATNPIEVIFTRGTTESINLLARAWGDRNLTAGDVVVSTPMEHHSNLVPWQEACRRAGATLRHVELTPEGEITEDALERAIGKDTRLVSMTLMSNVTGHMPPVERAIELAHAVGARVFLDGAQYVSHHPIDVSELGCDAVSFSGHKMCGPTGIGGLYASLDLQAELDPFQFGGDMISTVGLYESTWARSPEKFEAGTPNVAGAIGIGAAAEFLSAVGMEAIATHERQLLEYAQEQMSALDYVTLYGAPTTERRAGVLSFNLAGVHPHDVGSLLDQQGVAVRTGFHCAQPLMAHFGITGTVRASFYLYNTKEDVDRLVEAVEKVWSILGQ